MEETRRNIGIFGAKIDMKENYDVIREIIE